jgi:small nuclear ribonucleoprotein (snRNP)-like protein
MPFSLSALREFQDKRVRMRLDDGCEYIATFLSASQDTDGSLHLVYDRVEWANDPRELATAKDSTVYAEGESLVSIEEMKSKN